MVFVIGEAHCPKCGSKKLYITQEDWKPVTIKCYRVHACGWEVDLRQFWPLSKCSSCPVESMRKFMVPAACVGCTREQIEKEVTEK